MGQISKLKKPISTCKINISVIWTTALQYKCYILYMGTYLDTKGLFEFQKHLKFSNFYYFATQDSILLNLSIVSIEDFDGGLCFPFHKVAWIRSYVSSFCSNISFVIRGLISSSVFIWILSKWMWISMMNYGINVFCKKFCESRVVIVKR